ncbi:outer membrane protein assembly factor BamD [Caulobacter mirabilis]|uniref:Outer membrane protein assembly factor BamD n=1 Tax=Caulobacter mirabilis TaxID=69666 RepID=A0A2D2B0M2_9CAUL|nr:outer membrane protein assembly factor BamD [Caulobacter mirabilis]ATQ43789.1 outer membrane protein assembly factor BamD [Caulobacter mirabilis]
MLRRSQGRAAAVVVLAVSASLALTACVGKEKKPRLAYQERPVELLYNTGALRLDQRRWTEAVSYFQEVERQHPYSEWSRRSILMTAYAQYQANQYPAAIESADRFIQLYPGNPSVVYAYYLKAVCYFEQIVDVNRDQASSEQALVTLREIVQRYPTTEYAADARLKIDMVNDQLAGKEMAIGRYYLKQGQTLAAIGRFKAVVDKFQTTTHTPEALYRLVEAYLTLGLNGEAKANGAVLGYNFPGDPWYADAYRLLSDKGLQPAVEPKTPGAKQNYLDRMLGRKPAPPPPGEDVTPPADDRVSPESANPAALPKPKPKKEGWFSKLLGR